MSAARRPGREGAVDALVRAARKLFAERGPAAVSLRDVAREAGVNHGLIHHYIGSRDDLLRLVITTSMEQARAEVADAPDVAVALRALRDRSDGGDEYVRLLAWSLLEGRDPLALQGRSSALDAIVARAGNDSPELRLALAGAVVQMLGWKLFGDYALAAVGLDGDEPSVRADVAAMAERLLPSSLRDAEATS